MLNAIIDLSHHNSHVDFAKLKAAGIVGVIHKATQGARGVDPRYTSRRELAKGAGLLWGAYHFGTTGDGSEQADHFLNTALPDAQTLLVLDYEPNPQGATMKQNQAREFIQHVTSVRGRAPGLYTGASMVSADFSDSVFASCWLWWAQYGLAPSRIPKRTWPVWTMWQYTDGAVGPQPRTVDGVGACDRDQFNGDLAGLQRLWNVSPAAPAASPAEEARLQAFLTDLTDLSRLHQVGITGDPVLGDPLLFLLEPEDKDRVYTVDADSKLLY